MSNNPVKPVVDAIGAVGKEVGKEVGVVSKAVTEFLGHAIGRPNIDVTGTIFVTGATGVIGYRAALRLLHSGYPTVRVGARDPTRVEQLGKEGAEVADFCWDREDTYAKALDGVKCVFCVTPYMNGWDRRFPAFLQACKAAGVQYFVKLSFYHARQSGDPFQGVPLVKLHGNCDELVQKSGIPHTIIAASHFMSNPMVFQGREIMSDQKPAVFYGASGEKGVNYVSPNDVAEVAVRILFDPRPHIGKEHTLTGPEAIKDQVVAELLSKHLEKPIMYVDQPINTFEAAERKGGEPDWIVNDLVALEKVKASGNEELVSFVSKDIEKICGHEPENFEAYLQAKDYMTPRELGTRAA